MRKVAFWLAFVLAFLFSDNGTAWAANSAELVAIDILLLPDDAMVQRVMALNHRLLQNSPVGFALDATHVPHMTLLQCYVRQGDLAAVEAAVDAMFHREAPIGMRLTATGYFNSPVGPINATGIDAAKTAALAHLQQGIVAAVTPFIRPGGTAAAFVDTPASPTIGWTIAYVEKFLINSSGPKFGPHVTAGAGDPDFVARLAAGPFASFSFTIRGAAIYQLGDIGTARKQLWVWRP